MNCILRTTYIKLTGLLFCASFNIVELINYINVNYFIFQYIVGIAVLEDHIFCRISLGKAYGGHVFHRQKASPIAFKGTASVWLQELPEQFQNIHLYLNIKVQCHKLSCSSFQRRKKKIKIMQLDEIQTDYFFIFQLKLPTF